MVLMYSFSYLEPVCCSMSSSNYCFLTGIQISQEAGQVVWYSHLFQSFPQFMVIHTINGFGIVNKQKQMFFWNSLAFLMIQWMLAIWSLVPLPFLKPASLNIWKFTVHVLLKPGLENPSPIIVSNFYNMRLITSRFYLVWSSTKFLPLAEKY